MGYFVVLCFPAVDGAKPPPKLIRSLEPVAHSRLGKNIGRAFRPLLDLGTEMANIDP